MADFVDVIKAKWWQSETPPLPGHTIAKDLSIVAALLRQGWDREELLGGLAEYEGSPATLRLTYARGQRHLINRLVGQWRKKRDIDQTTISAILREIAGI